MVWGPAWNRTAVKISYSRPDGSRAGRRGDFHDGRDARMAAPVCRGVLAHGSPHRRNALRWTHIVALDQASEKWRPVTEARWDHERFAIHVWRSVRATGDTKTRKSRRSLGLPKRCVRSTGTRSGPSCCTARKRWTASSPKASPEASAGGRHAPTASAILTSAVRFSEGFAGPGESVMNRLSRPFGALAVLDVHV